MYNTSTGVCVCATKLASTFLYVYPCSVNHHTTGPEHLLSTVEKKTVSLYILHDNVKFADETCMRQYRACVM